MTQQQKRGAAIFSLLIVGIASVFVTLLFIFTVMGGGSLGDRFPGRQFMLLVHNWTFLSTLLKTLPPILTLGITIFAGYKLKDLQYYLTIAVSALGAGLSIYLILEISSVETARRFWAYSPVTSLEDYQSFVSAGQAGLGAVAVWLLAVFAIQIGVKRGTGGNDPGD